MVTDEARAWIGRESEWAATEVTGRDIQKYVIGTGDHNPIYQEDGAAIEVGHPSLVAPPLIYKWLIRPLIPITELTEDGDVVERRPLGGGGRVMLGGTDIEFSRYLRAGDVIRGTRRLVDLVEKHGRSSHFVVAKWDTTFFDAGDDVVIREKADQLYFEEPAK